MNIKKWQVKRLGDCTCEELHCHDCIFRYVFDGESYDKEVFITCVYHPKGATISQVLEMRKHTYTTKKYFKLKRKLSKNVIVVDDEDDGEDMFDYEN